MFVGQSPGAASSPLRHIIFSCTTRRICVASLLLIVGAGVTAHANDDRALSNPSLGPGSEHLFGFTEGSDIGGHSHIEAETETIGRFDRQANAYSAMSTTPTLTYGVTDQFRMAPAVTISSYSIEGFAGSDDHNRLSVDAVSAEFHYHPLDRTATPAGLTLGRGVNSRGWPNAAEFYPENWCGVSGEIRHFRYEDGGLTKRGPVLGSSDG